MTLCDELSSPEFAKLFQRERLETEFTEMVCRLMEERNVSRAELARRLGTSRAYITKLLRDGSNTTLKSMSDIVLALGSSLRLVDRPPSMWSHELLVSEVPHYTTPEISAEDIRLGADSGPASFEMVTESDLGYTTFESSNTQAA